MDKEGWWRTQVLPGIGYRISDIGYWTQVHMMFLGIPWYSIGISLVSSLAFILQEGFLGQVSTSSTGTGPSLVALGEILRHRRKVQ